MRPSSIIFVLLFLALFIAVGAAILQRLQVFGPYYPPHAIATQDH